MCWYCAGNIWVVVIDVRWYSGWCLISFRLICIIESDCELFHDQYGFWVVVEMVFGSLIDPLVFILLVYIAVSIVIWFTNYCFYTFAYSSFSIWINPIAQGPAHHVETPEFDLFCSHYSWWIFFCNSVLDLDLSIISSLQLFDPVIFHFILSYY